jgi:hypothetical protein
VTVGCMTADRHGGRPRASGDSTRSRERNANSRRHLVRVTTATVDLATPKFMPILAKILIHRCALRTSCLLRLPRTARKWRVTDLANADAEYPGACLHALQVDGIGGR